MNQQKIKYKDIMDLGFDEEFHEDPIYYKHFGYHWAIIQKKLTKKIYLDWSKETQLCEMVRIDNKKNCNILARMPINDLTELKKIISFFCEDNK